MRMLAIMLFAGAIGLVAVNFTVITMNNALTTFEHAISLGSITK